MPDLVARITAALEDKSIPLWFPDLTGDLAETGWQMLKQSIGLTSRNYGTARVLSGNPRIARNIIKHVPFVSKADDIKKTIPIELLTGDIVRRYEERDIRFYGAEEVVDNPAILSCVEDAIDILNQVPTLITTVATLVRALHILKPKSEDHDVSFSEPGIPFSIFVSVPERRMTSDNLRVAEAILHEAMHLQLSLIEQIAPLVASSSEKFFSPWRGEYRTAQGILHALYVFRVIEQFLKHLASIGSLTSNATDYIRDRCSDIGRQIYEIQSFRYCSEFTSIGVYFVERLL